MQSLSQLHLTYYTLSFTYCIVKTLLFVLRVWDTTDKNNLLHIMCGYQCDKAGNKNDAREMI